MKKNKQAKFYFVMILLTFGVMEIVSSIYYAQQYIKSPFAVVQIWDSVKQRIERSGILGQFKLDPMYVNDNRFGWTLKENSEPVRDCPGDYKMTYIIDSNKERFIPKPENSAGSIVFLGGSFTFGNCVNDSGSYPYILATEYWKNWEIRNAGVSGWGTSQAYLKVSDLIESNTPPSMIIYGMIGFHVQRNYLREIGIHKWGKSYPHFELVNGDLVFQGVVGPQEIGELLEVEGPYASIKNNRELLLKEIELTSAFLSSMKKKCAERGIPFIVVLLPTLWLGQNTYPPSVIDTMYKSNIPVLDLTKLQFEGLEYDPHPNPMDNRRIAEAIANSFILNLVQS